MVSIHAQSRFTGSNSPTNSTEPLVAPTPMMLPVMVCVVDTGMPIWPVKNNEGSGCFCHTFKRGNFVILVPIVLRSSTHHSWCPYQWPGNRPGNPVGQIRKILDTAVIIRQRQWCPLLFAPLPPCPYQCWMLLNWKAAAFLEHVGNFIGGGCSWFFLHRG